MGEGQPASGEDGDGKENEDIPPPCKDEKEESYFQVDVDHLWPDSGAFFKSQETISLSLTSASESSVCCVIIGMSCHRPS